MKIKSLVSLSLSTIVLVSCTQSNLNKCSRSAEELTSELRMIELDSPLKYLNVKDLQIDDHQNYYHKATIAGNITNTAIIADYKDLEIIVSFFTTTDTKIGEETHTVYKFFRHGEDTYISFEVENVPEEMNTFSCQISDAKPVFSK